MKQLRCGIRRYRLASHFSWTGQFVFGIFSVTFLFHYVTRRIIMHNTKTPRYKIHETEPFPKTSSSNYKREKTTELGWYGDSWHTSCDYMRCWARCYHNFVSGWRKLLVNRTNHWMHFKSSLHRIYLLTGRIRAVTFIYKVFWVFFFKSC